MNRGSHTLIGFAAGAAAAMWAGRPDAALVSGGIGALVSTMPDYDHRWGLPPRPRYARACRPMESPFEHRGMLHSPVVGVLLGWAVGLALLLSGLLSYQNAQLVQWAVVAGWGSHLAADWPSYMGIPLLWPASRRRYRLGRLPLASGNKLVEYPLSIAILGATVWAVWLAR